MMPAEPESKSTAPRKAISRRLRYEILRRDGHACYYCHATDVPLTIDHVLPVVLGGTDDPSNLVAACKDCNGGKTSSAPDAATVAQVDEDAARWAAAMKQAAERLAENKTAVSEHLKPWFDEWQFWAKPSWGYKLPADAEEVLSGYLAAGMPLDLLQKALFVTMRKQGVDERFRYFRGVANNMLAELQRDAKAILDADAVEPVPCPGNRDCTCPAHAWARGFDDAAKYPTIGYGWYGFRALSEVVDGPARWNARNKGGDA